MKKVPKPKIPKSLKLLFWWIGLPRFYKDAIKDAYNTTTKAILEAEARRTAARLAVMIKAQEAWRKAHPGMAANYEDLMDLWKEE